MTLSFSVETKATSYKIVNKDTGKAVLSGVKVTGKKAPYTATAKIEKLANGKSYTFQVWPVKKGGAPEIVSEVTVDLLSNVTWKTKVPVMKNPEQDAPNSVLLGWTGTDATYPDGGTALSTLNWKIFMDGAEVAAENLSDDVHELGTNLWGVRLNNVPNGEHTFQVQPAVTHRSEVIVADAESTLEKPMTGKKAAAVTFTIEDNYDVKWYAPVNIESAHQTAAKTVTIKFTADKPADSYNVYRIGKEAPVKTGIKLNSSGIGTAKVTGLTESAKKTTYYNFVIVPVLNGKEAETKDTLPWIRVPVYKYSWKSAKPNITLSMLWDHEVMAKTVMKEEIGEIFLEIKRGDGTVNTDWSPSSKLSYVYDREVPNGKQSFQVRILKSYCYTLVNPETGSESEPIYSGQTYGTWSAKKNITLRHMWEKKPTNVHVMQMDDMKVVIRFTVKATPDGDIARSYEVKDVTNSKKPVLLTIEGGYESWPNNTCSVTLYIQEPQKAGKHTYQVQAKHEGPSHGIDPQDTEMEWGVKATAAFTVQKDPTVWKTAPNVTSVRQSGEKEVIIEWISNNGEVDQYKVYEYVSKKYRLMGTVDKYEFDEGNEGYSMTIANVSDDGGEAGSKHVYVVQPWKNGNSKGGTYSNQKDGTVTVYAREWMPFYVSTGSVTKDHKLAVSIYAGSDLGLMADRYEVTAQNWENPEQEVVTATVSADSAEGDGWGQHIDCELEGLDVGTWGVHVTAIANDTPGRTEWSGEIPVLEDDYLLAPDVTLDNSELGKLTVNWTAQEDFPSADVLHEKYGEDAEGFYQIIISSSDGFFTVGSDKRSFTADNLPAGYCEVQVIPLIASEDLTNWYRTGAASPRQSTNIITSRMKLPDGLDCIVLPQGGSVEIPYTWEGTPVAKEMLYAYSSSDITANFETDGVMTVHSGAHSALDCDLFIGSSNGAMDEVSIPVYPIYSAIRIHPNPTAEEGVYLDADIQQMLENADSLWPVTLAMNATNAETGETLSWTWNVQSGWQNLTPEEPIILAIGTWKVEATATFTWNGQTLTGPVCFMQDTEDDAYETDEIVVGSIYTIVDGVKYASISDYSDESLNGYKVIGFSNEDDTRSELTVTGSIDGQPVVVIGANAFENKTNLATVHLPDSIVIIEQAAFKGCTSLKNMD